jgi:hypothetical protein
MRESEEEDIPFIVVLGKDSLLMRLVAKGWRRFDCCTDELILGLEEERDGNALRVASVDFECIIEV